MVVIMIVVVSGGVLMRMGMRDTVMMMFVLVVSVFAVSVFGVIVFNPRRDRYRGGRLRIEQSAEQQHQHRAA
jgi:hypothetical protein